MRVEFSSFVEGDLEAIADYIARDNPRRAASFIAEIRGRLRVLARDPLIHRLRPEIGEDARMALAGNYVVLFRIAGPVVRIERVVYGGRDLPGLLEEG